MNAHATVTRTEFEVALGAARDEGSASSYHGLSAPLDGGLLGRVAEVWESVEHALRQAFVNGADRAQAALDDAINSAERLIEKSGVRAKDVHQALLAKVHAFLARLLDAALSQVRRIVSIGDASFALDSLEVGQSVSLTGSVKASLTELVALASAGELTVTAHYKAAPPVDLPPPE